MVLPIPTKISPLVQHDKRAPLHGDAHPLFGAVVVPIPAVKEDREAEKRSTVNPLEGAAVIAP